jgi:hypothetical protein
VLFEGGILNDELELFLHKNIKFSWLKSGIRRLIWKFRSKITGFSKKLSNFPKRC